MEAGKKKLSNSNLGNVGRGPAGPAGLQCARPPSNVLPVGLVPSVPCLALAGPDSIFELPSRPLPPRWCRLISGEGAGSSESRLSTSIHQFHQLGPPLQPEIQPKTPRACSMRRQLDQNPGQPALCHPSIANQGRGSFTVDACARESGR